MKLFDHMQKARGERVPTKIGRTLVAMKAEPSLEPEPCHFRWTYSVSIGCSLTGPVEAEEDMARKARQMIARELYGEIENDIRDAIEVAYEETYRAHDDPLLNKLNDILQKVRGE